MALRIKNKDHIDTTGAARALDVSAYQFRRMVVQLAIEPATTRVNRYGKKCPIWHVSVVEQLRPVVAERHSELKRRSAAARQAVSTKEVKTLDMVYDWGFVIPEMPFDDLVAKAVAHYNARSDFSAFVDSEPAFLARITKNYLRHECTNYEVQLNALKGKIGKEEAYQMVKNMWDCAANIVYPQLILMEKVPLENTAR